MDVVWAPVGSLRYNVIIANTDGPIDEVRHLVVYLYQQLSATIFNTLAFRTIAKHRSYSTWVLFKSLKFYVYQRPTTLPVQFGALMTL